MTTRDKKGLMTKTHEIIPITDGYVVIDKDVKPVIGDFAYLEFAESPKDNEIYQLTDKTLDEGFKIIASIGIKIEGVPLINLPNEDDEIRKLSTNLINGEMKETFLWNRKQYFNRIKSVFKENIDEEVIQKHIHLWLSSHFGFGFKAGYKANTKQYSEEDMQNLLNTCKEAAMIGTSIHVESAGKQFIKSLQKVPISVELEYIDNGYEVDMEGRGGMDEGDTCWMERLELKVNPDNTITPTKINYNE